MKTPRCARSVLALLVLLLGHAPLLAAPPPPQEGIVQALGGEASGAGLPRRKLPPGERGGNLSLPGDPSTYVEVADALAAPGPLLEVLSGLHWPAGQRPDPRTLRIFVQGLNTPRADDPEGDIGADARLNEYLRQGYVAAPALAIHNASSLERAEVEPGRGLGGWFERRLRAALPLRARDGYGAALLRFGRVGAGVLGVRGEHAHLRDLLVRVLQEPDPPGIHLIGYSDGSLLVEHSLRLACERLRPQLGSEVLAQRLRKRVFLEYWGNVSPPLVHGPRRLYLHAADDVVTSRRVLGRRVGVLTWDDLPSDFRDETVLVTFDSHYAGWNGHNALTSIGPALSAILARELSLTSTSAPVAFAATPTLRLYDHLAANKARACHYGQTDLAVDFGRHARFLWRSGEAGQ